MGRTGARRPGQWWSPRPAMSELSAAAAAALGVPEPIVMRSAAARAGETGMTIDEVLSAWAGGETAPVAPAAPAAAPEPAVSPPPATDDAPAAPPSVAESPPPPPAEQTGIAVAAATSPTTVSGKPPVLIGKEDNPLAVLVGALGLFVAVFLVGLIGPALPADEPGARSSELPFTEAAQRGHDLYQSVGCASCHTQMVRPVIADVGLGAVTLSDSNQVLGTRRFGPDLSDVGSRLTSSQIEATVTGFGGHARLGLSQSDLDDLVAYLVESRTSMAPPPQPPPEEPAEGGGG